MKALKSSYAVVNSPRTMADANELMTAVKAMLRKSTLTTRTLAETFSAATAASPMAHIPFGTVLKHCDTVQHRDTHGIWCEARLMSVGVIGGDHIAVVLDDNARLSGEQGVPTYFFPAEWEVA